MIYKIKLTKQALKDKKMLEQSGLVWLINKVKQLLEIIKNNPFQNPPPYEKLLSHENRYSRRINAKHRLTYSVENDEIIIIRMWTHYE